MFVLSTLNGAEPGYTKVEFAKKAMRAGSSMSFNRRAPKLCSFTGIFAGVLLLLVLTSATRADQKTLLYNSGEDTLAIYSFGIIQRALALSEHEWRYEKVEGEISQARTIEMVKSGKLDVMWAATDQTMEDTLLPVRIPLLKGLLGYRILIINSGNQARFDSVRTWDDLTKLTMGQGSTWADTMILRHNGVEVVAANKYESLFHMVDGGRFDAFPRGVQEPWAEMASHPDLELSVERNLMLIYKMPFYLFVSPDNVELANELETGLRKMIADGSFHQYFMNDPTVQDVMNKSNIKHRLSFQLDNPTLPAKTPVDEAELWLDPTQL